METALTILIYVVIGAMSLWVIAVVVGFVFVIFITKQAHKDIDEIRKNRLKP